MIEHKVLSVGDGDLGVKIAPHYYQGSEETDPEDALRYLRRLFASADSQHMPDPSGVEKASGVRVLFVTDIDGHTNVWTGEHWSAI